MPLFVPPGFLRRRAGGSILVDFRASQASATNTSSPVFSSINIGTEAADRIIVAGWHLGVPWSGPCVMNVTGVGSINMQLASPSNMADNSALASLWWAHVPSGTTASFTGNPNSTSNNHAIGVWALYGADVVDPILDFNFTGSAALDPILSVDVAKGGAVIGMARQIDNVGTFTWSGLTENFDVTAGTENFRASGASGMFQNAVSNHDVEVTTQVGGTLCRLSIASFRPAS